MSVKGRATEFNTHLDAMVGNWVENVEQPKWLSVLSAKTSVDQDLLMVFYESINVPFIANLDSQNVLYILGHLLSVMKENMELMDKFFSSSINAENARKFVLSKDINIWTESGIKKFFTLVEMYVKGLSLLEIEQTNANKIKSCYMRDNLYSKLFQM